MLCTRGLIEKKIDNIDNIAVSSTFDMQRLVLCVASFITIDEQLQ